MGWYYDHPHFTDTETEVQRVDSRQGHKVVSSELEAEPGSVWCAVHTGL